jgi:hypothetical protein
MALSLALALIFDPGVPAVPLVPSVPKGLILFQVFLLFTPFRGTVVFEP